MGKSVETSRISLGIAKFDFANEDNHFDFQTSCEKHLVYNFVLYDVDENGKYTRL